LLLRGTLTLARRAGALLLLALLASTTAAAQEAPAQPPPERADPDARIDPLEPEFNLAALPTTLRMPARKLAFRVTHRFSRSLGQGDFGSLVSDLFGFDSGAQIGLELRYGLLPGTQVVVHRTSDREIQLTAQHSLLSERHGRPFGLDIVGGIDGDNNLRQQRRGIIGGVLSKRISRFGAVYAEPIWIGNTNRQDLPGSDNDTMLLGLGARLRLRPSLYLVGEISPRLSGYDPGGSHASFGIEGRTGGHLFQLNFSNGNGTTLNQLAAGSVSDENWYIGFNIARKFF
jgi:hypothetical protein